MSASWRRQRRAEIERQTKSTNSTRANKARNAGSSISGAGGEPLPLSSLSVEELLAEQMGIVGSKGLTIPAHRL